MANETVRELFEDEHEWYCKGWFKEKEEIILTEYQKRMIRELFHCEFDHGIDLWEFIENGLLD